jgi:hypothetical protein
MSYSEWFVGNCNIEKKEKRPTPEEMEWIEKTCDGEKPCEEICGKLGLAYCPLK